MLERLLLAIILGVPVAAALMIPLVDPAAPGGRSLAGLERIPCCGFRHFSSIPCPLCGLTRSFVSLAQGRILRAFMFNLMGPPLFVLFAFGAVWSFASAFRKRKPAATGPGAAASKRSMHGGTGLAVVAALFLAAWAAKLALVPREFW